MSGPGLWSSLRRTAALVRIEDASGVAAARYAAREVAMRAGVDIDGRERAALVATELASNAWRHAGGGELHVWTDGRGESPGSLGVLAVDRGPGIADVRAALRDGVSSAGSLGHGLGAVQRLASWVGIATDEGVGTVVSAELGADPPAPWAALARPWRAPPPTRGEPCGDGWALVEEPGGARSWLVVDGLGHGAKAEEAARAALAVFDPACAARGPAAVLGAVHEALVGTRGAVAACARLEGDLIRYAGVGNIRTRVLRPGGSRSLGGRDGLLGDRRPSIHEQALERAPEERWLVMHSDGLDSRWNLPERRVRLAAPVVLGILYRDAAKDRDDATVIVQPLSLTAP